MAVEKQGAAEAVENELEQLLQGAMVRAVRLFQPVVELPVSHRPPPQIAVVRGARGNAFGSAEPADRRRPTC